MIWLVYHGYILVAFALYLIGVWTDRLDGKAARARNEVTAIGKILDPLADKVLTLGSMFLLGIPEDMKNAWFFLLGLEFSLMLLGLSAFLHSAAGVNSSFVKLGANLYGKIKFVAEASYIIARFLDKLWHVAGMHFVMWLALLFATGMALMSIVGHLGLNELIPKLKNRA